MHIVIKINLNNGVKSLQPKIKNKMEVYKLIDKTNLHLSLVYPRAFERFGVKGENLVGVEIGVWKGEHAKSLLKSLNIKKLFLIDPYIIDKDYDGSDMNNEIIRAKDKAEERLIFFDNVNWIFEKSEDAVDSIPNNLDFVYIDGNHSYKYVKKDIELYYKKIKKGGILGGHDITIPSVAKAVCEFVAKNNLDINIRGNDWWVKK